MLNIEELCCKVCGIAKHVGGFIRQELGKVSTEQIEHKSLNSLVSYVDKTAEAQLVEALGALVPNSTFLAEEGTLEYDANADWRWIIDPLDGTTNFLHQIPFFSISIALQRAGKTVLGVVYEVNREELFYAWEGSPAYLNGKQIRVRDNSNFAEAMVATGFPYYDFKYSKNYTQLLMDLMQTTRGIRRLGSAALDLAYVACGRFDVFFEYSLSPWDVAAGAFLVQQAGGVVSDFSGHDNYLFGREISAGTYRGHAVLLDKIQQYFDKETVIE